MDACPPDPDNDHLLRAGAHDLVDFTGGCFYIRYITFVFLHVNWTI